MICWGLSVTFSVQQCTMPTCVVHLKLNTVKYVFKKNKKQKKPIWRSFSHQRWRTRGRDERLGSDQSNEFGCGYPYFLLEGKKKNNLAIISRYHSRFRSRSRQPARPASISMTAAGGAWVKGGGATRGSSHSSSSGSNKSVDGQQGQVVSARPAPRVTWSRRIIISCCWLRFGSLSDDRRSAGGAGAASPTLWSRNADFVKSTVVGLFCLFFSFLFKGRFL